MKIRSVGWAIAALMVLFLANRVFASAITYNTVSALDPNNGTTITITDAASNSLANGITLAAFTPLVSNAWNSDTGGVYNFERAQISGTDPGPNATIGDSSTNAISGLYGTSLSNTFKFYRSDSHVTSTVAFDYNTNNGAVLASGSSGGGYLGIQGFGDFTMSFITQPIDVGITDIARSDGGVTGGFFTVTFSDNSTLTTSTALLSGGNAAAPNPPGVFYGIAAPSGLTIASLSWTPSAGSTITSGFSRYDDLAFVVGVPEPASLILLGLGGTALALSAIRSRKST